MDSVKGNIVDVHAKRIFYGEVILKDERILEIRELDAERKDECYVLPGFVDSHVHIESSMLIPSRFAEKAVCFGTVASVSDPHEIANVMGEEGINYMVEDGSKVPLKFYFGVPSCVPATNFESSGCLIDAEKTGMLLKRNEFKYLGEMMNFPGVIFDDQEVHEKIRHAIENGKPIDGHAPGLKGEDLKKYVGAKISTDHEAYELDEAEEKIKEGMIIQIREGSAAKNFETLHPLISKYPEKIMLCSDDLHPDDLQKGHINKLIRKGVEKGHSIFDLIKMANSNPVDHYKLEVGCLKKGDFADIVVVNNLKNFDVLKTIINGEVAFDGKEVTFDLPESPEINNFHAEAVTEHDIQLLSDTNKVKTIVAIDGELITEQEICEAAMDGKNLVSNVDDDVLKIVVYNRYRKEKPAIGFIKNFGIKKGAIASSIAHDSHNIIALGASDGDIVHAINEIVKAKGGIVAVEGANACVQELPVAGIMSTEPASKVADNYKKLNKICAELGSSFKAPYMTLSFMALLVIPKLKLSDKGLFDGSTFKFTNLFPE